jgi:hypothetical protein
MQNGRAARSHQAISANDPGLCGDCLHASRITTDKDSMFLQCRLSFTDPRFKKYPALPVLQCSGYEKKKSVEG